MGAVADQNRAGEAVHLVPEPAAAPRGEAGLLQQVPSGIVLLDRYDQLLYNHLIRHLRVLLLRRRPQERVASLTWLSQTLNQVRAISGNNWFRLSKTIITLKKTRRFPERRPLSLAMNFFGKSFMVAWRIEQRDRELGDRPKLRTRASLDSLRKCN